MRLFKYSTGSAPNRAVGRPTRTQGTYVGDEPIPDGGTVTVGTTSYEAYNEILPGFSDGAIVVNAGAQHERNPRARTERRAGRCG